MYLPGSGTLQIKDAYEIAHSITDKIGHRTIFDHYSLDKKLSESLHVFLFGKMMTRSLVNEKTNI